MRFINVVFVIYLGLLTISVFNKGCGCFINSNILDAGVSCLW